MSPRITQFDLARLLGVHVTTISKALKNQAGIAPKTRARVHAAAARVGYVPDPMLHALAAYRTARRPAAFQAVLAWLNNYPRSHRMDRFAGFADYETAARARALALGYRLETFYVENRPRALVRLADILQARNISGLVVGPQVQDGAAMEFPWAGFSAVTIGFTLAQPQLNVVTNDHFHTILSLYEELRQRGYRRIGCYLRRCDNERIEGRFFSALTTLTRGKRHAVLIYDQSNREGFIRWMQAGKFDAIITGERTVVPWLQSNGARIPAELGVAHYALEATETELSGMYLNNARIGAAAIDWLAGLVQRGEKGPPHPPARLMIESQWIEGRTLRARVVRSHTMRNLDGTALPSIQHTSAG